MSDNVENGNNYFRSRAVTALHIGYDILIDLALVGCLLVTLSLIHLLVHNIDVSGSFKKFFSTLHETAVIANYLLLAVKGILRFWRFYD